MNSRPFSKEVISNTLFTLFVSLFSLFLCACTYTETLEDKNEEQSSQASESTLSIAKLADYFADPKQDYYPETWFHLNGKNISKAGLIADLEAIHYSGMQGLQLFNKRGPTYPNVPQISILSPEWEEMIALVADESDRLGLKLSFQNCPGWSMAGGPWVPVEESQRELIQHEYQFAGGQQIQQPLTISNEYLSEDRNYQDVKVLAFKTPHDHNKTDYTPSAYETNNKAIPWRTIFEKDKRFKYDFFPFKLAEQEPYRTYQQTGIHPVQDEPTWIAVSFDSEKTIRSIELPPPRSIFTNRQYPKTNINIKVEAKLYGEWSEVTTLELPSTHWYDSQYAATLAIPETTSETFRFTFLNDPLFLAYVKLHGRAYLHNHESKASKSSRNILSNVAQEVETNLIVDSTQLLDISKHLNNDGTLNWQAPEGQWTVVRFGHVNMLRTNKPAEPEATGWEVSKVDKIAIENHLRHGMMGQLMRDGGPLDGHSIHGILIDSWESYVPTWTMDSDGLIQEFQRRRGYDMTPYLPATFGLIVDSVDKSNRFLRDLRQTMDDLYVEHFFEHFRTVSHDMGAKVYTEGAVGETLPGDPLRYYGVSDYPMTEFWYPKAPSNQKEAKPIYAAASAYHLYNKPYLSAEAATQLNFQWNESPRDISYLINENFAKGVNHLVFHTFSHSPQIDVVPGSSFGGRIGFPLMRTQTWWRHTPTWMKSLARAQYLLQQGEFVADVLWYLGDELDRPPFDTHPFVDGYKFDYLNEELLQSKVKVTNGQLHVEGAGEYQIIMLRDSQNMTLSTARKLKELVLLGAVIFGNKPMRSPSLMDDEQDVIALGKIADEMWGNSDTGSKSVGLGKVYWGYKLKEVLNAEAIQADVVVSNDLQVSWLHRTTPEAEIYYISNQHNKALDVAMQFRDGQGQAEIWNVDTGETYPASLVDTNSENSSINLTLQLAPNGSQFVVFNKTSSNTIETSKALLLDGKEVLSTATNWYRLHEADQAPVKVENGELVSAVSGEFTFIPSTSRSQLVSETTKASVTVEKLSINLDENEWQLAFVEGWDTPSTVKMLPLRPLHLHENKAVRHYSGTVEYSTAFMLDERSLLNKPELRKRAQLNLGQVNDIAELWLNGKRVDTRWAPPYTFSVGEYLVPGQNTLKVMVTNTWRNQLIYDNSRAENEKKTWTTNPPKKDDTTLDPSGLIGPVTLQTLRY